MKNGLAVFVSYLSKGDKCVLHLFELKSGDKGCVTETCWRIYVSGLICVLLCSNICCYERIQQTTLLT
jgi:hypothetical protein